MKIKIYRCLLYHNALMVLNRLSTASDGQRKQMKKIDRAPHKIGKNAKRVKEKKGYKVLGESQTTRKPILLLRLSGVSRLRAAERHHHGE
jgi:hypothetical protein